VFLRFIFIVVVFGATLSFSWLLLVCIFTNKRFSIFYSTLKHLFINEGSKNYQRALKNLQTGAQKFTNERSLVYLLLFLTRKKQQGASPYCFVLDVNFFQQGLIFQDCVGKRLKGW
jgi:hypothetical protein